MVFIAGREGTEVFEAIDDVLPQMTTSTRRTHRAAGHVEGGHSGKPWPCAAQSILDDFVGPGAYCGYVDTHKCLETPLTMSSAWGRYPTIKERGLPCSIRSDYAAKAGVVPAIASAWGGRCFLSGSRPHGQGELTEKG